MSVCTSNERMTLLLTLIITLLLLVGYAYSLQPYRTAFHFQPRKNFINDPNGPMIYKGVYHLFYQYNPKGAVFGEPVWGHSTSTDLVNWIPQPIAIEPQMKSNMKGSWSGSATILPQNYTPAILFTGITPKLQQVQNLALPKNVSDPFLKEWVLVSNNPVISATRQSHINSTWFRDPSTAWMLPDGKWRVVVGSKTDDDVGKALLYTSKDFTKWTSENHPLYFYPNTGMWECPDFFPIHYVNGTSSSTVKYVLKVSLDNTKNDIYTIGTYNTTADVYIPDMGFANDSSLRYDYGKYYASKSFFDETTKRRILLGWLNESSIGKAGRRRMGWSGIHAVPRSIWLDNSGKKLIQWPISEIETLRANPVRLPTQVLKKGAVVEIPGVTASQADLCVTFNIIDWTKVERFQENWTDPESLCTQKGTFVEGDTGPFGLFTLVSESFQEFTAVFFRIFNSNPKPVVLMCIDHTRSSKDPSTNKRSFGAFIDADIITEGLPVRILIDHSVIEAYAAKGKTVMTTRVYPLLAIFNNTKIYFFNYGSVNVKISQVVAYSMKRAFIA